jgi:hypothetical protein
MCIHAIFLDDLPGLRQTFRRDRVGAEISYQSLDCHMAELMKRRPGTL